MPASSRQALGSAGAWSLVLAVVERARAGRPIARGTGLALGPQGELVEGTAGAWVVVRPDAERGWSLADGAPLEAELERTLDLYGPLCFGRDDAFTIAHLAQTLDGRIALTSGQSKFISGHEDLVHTHRLRALCDVVLVGRRTVEVDDPQLSTRLCPGSSPVRAVIDPARRLRGGHRVFQDGLAPTLLFCRDDVASASARHGGAEVVGVAPIAGRLPVERVVAELHRRGLRRILVEGGGVTVSRFLEARAIDRLHVTVAPRLLGSGVPSLSLPEMADLSGAVSLAWRPFVLGSDVLLDCTIST